LVSTLIREQQAAGVSAFTDLISTRPTQAPLPQHNVVADEFLVSAPVAQVIEHYITANPSDAWSGGKLVQFGLAVNKNNGDIYYPNQPYPGAEVGHVFYIHLNIWGLKKICMGQEIVEVDRQKGTIVFSYIEGGKTDGMQEMRFVDQGDGTTKIIHTSYFKGVSPFRDKYLYPYFHSMVVKRFHHNLAASLG
jgi:hypothetical protein